MTAGEKFARKFFEGQDEEVDLMKEMLSVMVKEVMKEEVSLHVGAERHERGDSRRGHRNGYKPRKLKTRLGELEFEVPQVRGMEPYLTCPTIFGHMA